MVPLLIHLLAHGDFYFSRPVQDGGDFAANALRIRDAKTFQEIHGNYSRWGFNHPGPALFYAYAWGELLFHDLLHLSPAPHNAHALTLLLLQSALFAAAVAVCRRFITGPAFVPLVLALGLTHFWLAKHAFTSLWPPHQFLMAFVLMLVSAAAVAAGDRRVLPLLVLACCLCVHAHVAQPLFAVPLFALALVSAVARAPGPGVAARLRSVLLTQAGAISLGLIALFLVPIAVDALRGEDSNLQVILDHMRRHASEGHSLSQSLSYLLAFLTYWGFHDQLSGVPAGRFILQHPGAFAAWAAILLLPAVRLLRPRPADAATPFRRALWAVFALSLALTLVWGRIMDGEMWAFNAFFNYGILFLPLIVVADVLSGLLPEAWGRRSPWALAPVAALLLVALRPDDVMSDSHRPPLDARALVSAAVGPTVTVPEDAALVLTFGPGYWPQVIALAIQLERAGIPWRVTEDWGFMFGRKRTLRSLPPGQPTVCLEASPAGPKDAPAAQYEGVAFRAVRFGHSGACSGAPSVTGKTEG